MTGMRMCVERSCRETSVIDVDSGRATHDFAAVKGALQSQHNGQPSAGDDNFFNDE